MPPEFRTKDLSVQFAKLCIKIKTPIYLSDQLQRAACSVTLNLCEGAARHTKKDRNKHYRIALGSFREAEAIIELIEIKNPDLMKLKNHLAGSLVNLCKATS